MKHLLTLLFSLVLCASSFSQFIFVSPLTYDSLLSHHGFEDLSATATFQSNTVYYATSYFRWSTSREELENGGGYLVDQPQNPLHIIPGLISRTEIYTIHWWDYQELAPIGSGIYFKIHIDVYDEDNVQLIETFDTSVRTWRFPTVFTSMEEKVDETFPLYPNPTSDYFFLPSGRKDMSLTLVSSNGNRSQLSTIGGIASVEGIDPGQYLVVGQDQKYLGKVVVSR